MITIVVLVVVMITFGAMTVYDILTESREDEGDSHRRYRDKY